MACGRQWVFIGVRTSASFAMFPRHHVPLLLGLFTELPQKEPTWMSYELVEGS